MHPWLPRILIVSVVGLAAACNGAFNSDVEGADSTGVGGFGASGGAGADGPDGSIDVASDGDPGAPPQDYSALCGLPGRDSDAAPSCVAGAEADGCTSTQGGGSSPVSSSCQLVASEAGVTATCGVPGSAEYNQPCMSAANCQAGLGCAVVAGADGNGTAGACLDYCCGDVEECPKDTYCAPQAMTERPDLSIPVCILATKCTLLDDSTCPAGLTCAIVRADGTTSCVVPGHGKDGEPCENGACAPGFTCLKLANTCKQLCRLDHPEDCPMGSTCLSGSGEYPDNYGTCTEGDGYN